MEQPSLEYYLKELDQTAPKFSIIRGFFRFLRQSKLRFSSLVLQYGPVLLRHKSSLPETEGYLEAIVDYSHLCLSIYI